MAHHELPPISALFLAKFDQRVGYILAWKRSLDGIDLDGVEYRCLPSGLHSVREDLVFFTSQQSACDSIYEEHVGISAFAQGKAGEERRNAEFAAVGVLVAPGKEGLGRAWLHAKALRDLAKQAVNAPEDVLGLEQYWETHGRADGTREPKASTTGTSISPGGLKRKRSHSDAAKVLQMDETTPADHPAFFMSALLATFGPLIFPLHRAALLRKRILLLGTTPVQPACNFVYNLSILSAIPQSSQADLQSRPGVEQLKSLYNVGIFDTPRLKGNERGYLACTTDDILGEKTDLYDILVELPPSETTPGPKRWPRIRTADGKTIKATQRDFRRYNFLRREMRRLHPSRTVGMQYRDSASMSSGIEEETPLIHSTSSLAGSESHAAEAEVVEPETWSSVAYRSFMYWASVGELEAWEAEEALVDQSLVEDLPSLQHHGHASDDDAGAVQYRTDDDDNDNDDARGALSSAHEAQHTATALVTYLHNLTTLMLKTLCDAVEGADHDRNGDHEPHHEAVIEVLAADARKMGIDTWSLNELDRDFIPQAVQLYYGREAVVAEEELVVCGMRIC